jgi:hypothetical protein
MQPVMRPDGLKRLVVMMALLVMGTPQADSCKIYDLNDQITHGDTITEKSGTMPWFHAQSRCGKDFSGKWHENERGRKDQGDLLPGCHVNLQPVLC